MAQLQLREDQWAQLYAMLQAHPGIYVGQEPATRRSVEAVLWRARGANRGRPVRHCAQDPPKHGFRREQADPLTSKAPRATDVRRLNAARGQRAQLGREIRSCALRKDALARADRLPA